MLLFGVGGLLLTGAGYWLFFTGNSETPGQSSEIASQNIKVSTDDLAARNLSEKEWLSMSENRLTQQDNQIRDRKRVVSGKSGSVRVDIGGRRIDKKKII